MKQKDYVLTITVHPDQISCILLEHQQQKQPAALIAYNTYHCTAQELHNLIIFKPHPIELFIKKFLQEWHCTTIPSNFVFDGHLLHEQIVPTQQSIGTQQPLSADWFIKHQKLSCSLAHEHAWLLIGLQKPLLLQYHLLAHRLNMPINIITTQTAILLNNYAHILPKIMHTISSALACNQVRDVIALMTQKSTIELLLSIPPAITIHQNDIASLACATSILLSEGKNNEQD